MRWSKAVVVGYLAVLVVLAGAHSFAEEPLVRRPSGRLMPGQWLTEVAKLTASDAGSGDLFGTLWTNGNLSGDTAVIGAYLDDHTGGTDAGSAYVFTRSGDTWTEQQKLTASDAEAGDGFGGFVAVSGDTAVITAYLDDHSGFDHAGSVYVFERSGDTWIEQQKITLTDPRTGDQFGWVVAISNETFLVGAADWQTSSPDPGSAYVYTRSGGSWDLQETLTASDGEAGDLFGFHVALSGDTAVVGACWDDHSGYLDAGSAYIFTRTGDSWTEQQKLIASDPGDGDEFGVVAISGETILVGASGDDHSGYVDAGSVYVFTRSGDTWTEQQKLTASNATSERWFGNPANISGDIIIVSAQSDDHSGFQNAGSIYVFTRSGTTWTERQKATASDPGDGDLFGWGIPVSGDTVITGAPMDDHSGLTDAGSVYIFNLAQFLDGFESGDTAAWSQSVP